MSQVVVWIIFINAVHRNPPKVWNVSIIDALWRQKGRVLIKKGVVNLLSMNDDRQRSRSEKTRLAIKNICLFFALSWMIYVSQLGMLWEKCRLLDNDICSLPSVWKAKDEIITRRSRCGFQMVPIIVRNSLKRSADRVSCKNRTWQTLLNEYNTHYST